MNAIIGRDGRGDWTISYGRFRATVPATGPEPDAWVEAGKPSEADDAPERVRKLAAKVPRRAKRRAPAGDRIAAPQTVRDVLVPLDGEEAIIVKGTRQPGGYAIVAPWRVDCRSPRCRDDEPFKFADHVEAEEDAERHRQWHRENFPTHPRVELDYWIARHAHVTAPEPDWAELDAQLAIARTERKVG